ncbi:YjgN family protein [Rhizobium sp. LjRoot254]|uniref:YjgN family protein n=1 Tax=Rhizobium sp. LjRoot254 TaxID=3342297 RepID=UPI003ECE29E8
MVMDVAVVDGAERDRIRREEQAAALFTEQRRLEETHVLHRAEFHGNAREYFGIWVVNTLFTLLTLGLYAPWAKVRRNRYFHANTTLGGFAFDYHATGGQLLKGWLLVAAYLIGYNLIVDTYPLASLGVLAVVLGIFPWLVERALRFKAKVTSYRNLRFHFHGKLSKAYISVLLGGLLGLFSIGLLAPIFSKIYYRYMFDGVSYGGRRFDTTGRIWTIYKTIWLPAIVLVVGLLPTSYLIGYAMLHEYQVMPTEVMRSEWWRAIFHAIFSYIAIIPFLLAYYLMLIIYRTGVRNVMWSAATFDGRHRLVSDIPRMRYAWILISNTVVTILSLGLLRPWAAVRERRFLVAFTGIWITGDMEELQAELETSGSAFGSEFMDSDGFDLGF